MELALQQNDTPAALAFVADYHRRRLHDVREGAPGPLQGEYRGLPAGVVLEYFVLPDRTLIGVRTSSSVRLVVAEVPDGRLIERVRGLHEAAARREVDRVALIELYGLLLAPVLGGLQDGSVLTIVPDGPLWGVPFGALQDPETGSYLIETRAVRLATRWEGAVGAVAARSLEHGGVVANPSFDRVAFGDLPDLPGAEAEALSIAASFPGARVLAGSEATPQAVLGAIRSAGFLHVGAHAVLTPEGSLLLPLTPPAPGADGLLSADDLFSEASVTAGLVTLAACQTSGSLTAGGEAGLGLARPFLAAGVPAVLTTLWSVDDDESQLLIADFYRALRSGESASAALRRAQLSLIAADKAKGRSGIGWASFQLIGDVVGKTNATKGG